MKTIRVAIAGNPNSGKSSIFNAMTGSRQHVGNYPGVTVEKKEGSFNHKGIAVEVIDLPGTYSLTSRSLEERIARDFLIDEKPDIIVDVVDVSNLERNLYLTTQLTELEIPLIVALNMSDRSKSMGQVVDINYFAELTNTRVVETVGYKGKGILEIKDIILEIVREPLLPHKVDYGIEIMTEIGRLVEDIDKIDDPYIKKYKPRWLAIKLLENDAELANKIKDINIADQIEALSKHFGDDTHTIFAEKRYGYISGLYHETITENPSGKIEMSEHIDSILTHKILGLPIFLGLMYLTFLLTFKIGNYPMNWIEAFFNFTSSTITTYWPQGTLNPLRSLIVDGIIGGVGGVVVFLPNIIILFLAIAILEDTGYMSRAAFIMDRLMHKIGLHGKSFIPMMIGFGCTVPAIMATRIIEDKRDRLTTMMILPLMSCGARFPIYMLIIPAFFPEVWRARVLWIIYMIGVIAAIFLAKILKKTVLKGTSTPFVMELPPYRLPTVRGLLSHVRDRSWLYIKKAGTVILGISIVMWFVTSYPKPPEHLSPQDELKYSAAGRIGQGLETIFKPLGFDWKISTALLGSFAAKEVFVAQMGIVNSIGDNDDDKSQETLRNKLRKDYSPLTGFCVMMFCLIATPCMATVVVTKRESGSWRWALFQFFGLTVMAYILTLIVYQIGSLFL